MAEQPPGFKYWAFLSYSHQDARWAAWLHHAIETYSGHRKLVGKPNKQGEPVPARLFPVFRDREELEGVPDLPTRIQEALVQARYLIVLCSPRAAASRWVDEEIRAFKALGREDQVLAFIVDGEPNTSDRPGSGLQECFPAALRTRFDADGQATGQRAEPGAPDAREGKDGRHNALVKLVARLLGVDLDELRQRDLERRRRRWFLLSAGLMALVLVLAGLSVYAFNQKGAAEMARQLAVSNEKLAERNATEATRQRDAADTQRGIALRRQREAEREKARAERERAEAVRQRGLAEQRARIALSRQLAAAAVNALPAPGRADSDLPQALLLAAQAVSTSPTVEARSALLRALQNSSHAMRILRTPMRGVNGLGFSPDGKLLAVHDWWGGLVLGDLAGPQPLYDRPTQSFPALSIRTYAFGPDGRTLALGASRRLLLWDMAGRRFRAESPRLHKDEITALAFDQEGGRLASASNDGEVRLWSATDLRPLGEPLHAPGGQPLRLAFCPGERLATVGQDRRLTIWHLPDRCLVTDQRLGEGKPLASANLDADCHILALGGAQPLLWDVRENTTWLQVPRNQASGNEATAIALAPEGRRVALAGPGDLALWSLNGPLDTRLPGHTGQVGAVAFSPDGKVLASAGKDDGQVILWDVAEGAMPLGRRFADHIGSSVTGLSFSPDGRKLLSLYWDGTLSLRETKNYTALRQPAQWHRGGPATLAFTPDGRRMVLGSWDGGALVCLNARCQPLGKAPQTGLGGIVPADAGAVVIGFSRDSRYAALTRRGRPVEFWELRTAQPADSPVPGGKAGDAFSFAYGPGKSLAWSDASGQIFLWDGRRKRRLEPAGDWLAGAVTRLLFSPDGSSLLSLRENTQGNASLALWDTRTGQRLSTLPEIRGRVGALGFDPKGGLLAVGEGVGTGKDVTNYVVLWDVVRRKALSEPLRGHGGPVTSLTFSPDGKTLVTGAGDVIVWDVDPASWVDRACEMANREMQPREWAELVGGDVPYQPTCGPPPATLAQTAEKTGWP